MTTSAINGLNNPSTTNTSTQSSQTLGQAEFLRLMTTQLTTQDPFNPMDNTQMVAQMAQFSQVAGIAEMNASLQTIAAGLGGNRLSDAASWIGHSMLVESDVATPLRDGTYAGEFTLEKDATNVTVSFVNADGAVVHSQALGEVDSGEAAFAWDGKNEAGEYIGGGPLRMVVTATVGGQTVTPKTATWTTIAGIQSPANGGESRLVTGLGLLTPDKAIRLA
ncbi:flagellar hook capping FlgD N-terminal domain-containing protein [Sphingosinicella sp. LHD-64]|uniref:flagellar hook assembly protein FlgD n=1 Tax=Sphingosinicella sp. LHD-64 TaxID=3072139 RepID=UPI00280DC196|nr:flagellar hook capping FlgD N-terminal domain-containing protein [Sphingosinicella sp. LHD-64]MDQ8757185.1 flagellar hook capping FlgD N-terminal domain-containing protein [Sphingosinicella sp. LHD-64]